MIGRNFPTTEMKMTKPFCDPLALPSLSRNIAYARRKLIRGACLLVAMVMTACTVTNRNAQDSQTQAAGGFIELGTLGGTGTGSKSEVRGIAADGSVVGGVSSTTANKRHAFRWASGVMTNLGTLIDTYSISEARGVAADGSVIVGRSDAADQRRGDQHAFRWQGGVMTDLGTLDGRTSAVNAVSADGSVVVGVSTTASGDAHAFRWQNGVMTDLGTLGGKESSALAVSADGSVVVGWSDASDHWWHDAFRWTAATGMQRIEDWVKQYRQASIRLKQLAISADGSVVVGDGTDSEGKFAWLARISPSGSGNQPQPRSH
jgi:probable HAF family extracellular repeat protein